MGNDTNGLRIIDAKRTLSAGAALLLTGLASVGLASQFAAQAAVPSFYVGRANAAAIDVAVSPGQQALGQDRDAGALVAQAVV
ncbi:MAG: hypothetical protein QOE58_751, partial [Actinomycetota bacterium]|nr:hypothetical protein [Actinomycetota bacterium]